MWCFNVFIFALYTKIVECIIVSINQGQLEGEELISRNGTRYFGFHHIPYAKPPIGKLRFEPPEEPDSWNGVRNSTEDIISPCVQMTDNKITGSEDCLYLDVYTPNIKPSTLLPVMVFLHMGSFTHKSYAKYPSAIYSTYIMDNAVVLVTLQFRIHIFGFLSAADQVLPGNYGMKDQVAALKWVQKNIAAFGGNPKTVTIFGQNGGAASVQLHFYSPLSKGLFHRAISQSGSALGIGTIYEPHLLRSSTLKYADFLGCSINSTKMMVNCLRKKSVSDLMKAWIKIRGNVLLRITIERENENAFITSYPWNTKPINNVPWIIGVNSAEGSVYASRYLLKEKYKEVEFEKVYSDSLEQYCRYTRTKNVSELLKKFYFGKNKVGLRTAKSLSDLYGDIFHYYDCMEAAFRLKGTVYFYYLNYINVKCGLNEFCFESFGAPHTHELKYLFEDPASNVNLGENDLAISHRIIKKWITFAYTGNPNDDEELWRPVQSSHDLEYLHIRSKKDEMKKGLLKERFQFWKRIKVHVFRNTETNSLKDEL